MTIDKLTLGVVSTGSAGTIAGSGKSVMQEDSFIKGLLESSVTDILAGNFTWYGSDVFALVSLSATLIMLIFKLKGSK